MNKRGWGGVQGSFPRFIPGWENTSHSNFTLSTVCRGKKKFFFPELMAEIQISDKLKPKTNEELCY